MQRAVLLDERAAIDAYNFVLGECFFERFCGFAVIVRLCVCGVEHAVVHDEEVRVCCRQTLAVLVVYGIGRGQGNHPVWVAVSSAQRCNLLFHSAKVGILCIVLVGTLHIYNGVGGCKACNGIDVTIGVVADEIAVVPGGRPANGEKPPHVLKVKPKKKKTEEEADDWLAPVLFAEDMTGESEAEKKSEKSGTSGGRKRRRNRRPKKKAGSASEKTGTSSSQESTKKQENKSGAAKSGNKSAPKGENGSAEKNGEKAKSRKRRRPNRRKPKKKEPAGE